jgi:hypothetical protein
MTDNDRDWLLPDPDAGPDSTVDPVLRLEGVLRVDAQGEMPTAYATLYDATREPPLSPEAEVRGPGGCLAQCAEDVCCWVFTVPGKAMLDREIRGTTGRAA